MPPPEGEPIERRTSDGARQPRRGPPRWALALAVVAHLGACAGAFPPAETWRDAPFLGDDHVVRYHYASQRAALLARGQLTGYEPRALAGSPVSPILLAGAHLFDVAIAAGAPLLGAARTFNLVTVALVAGALPVLAGAVALLGLGTATAAWTFVLGLPLFWSGLPLSFAATGSPSWLAAVPLALATLALYRRALGSHRARDWGATAAAAALLGLVQVLGVLLVAAVALPLAIERARAAPRRTLVGTAAVASAAATVNAFWLVPFVARRADGLGWGGGTRAVLDAGFSLYCLAYPLGLPALALLVGLAGAGRRLRRPGLGPVLGVGATSLAVALLGYRVAWLTWMEPYRFVLPVHVVLLVVAAAATVDLAAARPRLRGLLGVLAPALAVASVAGLRWLDPDPSQLPIRSRLPPGATELLATLATHSDPEGRLLLEDSGWARPDARWTENLFLEGHRYFGTHLPAALPVLLGVETLNGAYPGPPFVVHQVVSFESGLLDARPIGDWPEDELRALLDRYAVRRVLVWSAAARAALTEGWDWIEPLADVGDFALFAVRSDATRFARGGGRVAEAALDRLVLDDLVPEGDAVVLRYHYDDALRAVPPVRIERAPVAGDPIGFVRLVDPPTRVVLGFRPR